MAAGEAHSKFGVQISYCGRQCALPKCRAQPAPNQKCNLPAPNQKCNLPCCYHVGSLSYVFIVVSNAGQITFRGRAQEYWLPTPFACFPFTSPPVRHRVPSRFNWALLPLIRTPRLPVVNWHPCRFKWTRPFRWKTKSGFCACAITFQTQSTRCFLSFRLHEISCFEVSYLAW
jgi:hypothetical protein